MATAIFEDDSTLTAIQALDAYVTGSDATRRVVRDMLSILRAKATDDDEKSMAWHTIAEVLGMVDDRGRRSHNFCD